MQLHEHPDDSTDLWADDTSEHTDELGADPADILADRELRDGVNLLGMPIEITTH